MSKIDLNLVPDLIKDIAQKAHPSNIYVNDQERSVAQARLESIKLYCEKALEVIIN